MLNENAQKWVAALRSGEYKQGRCALRLLDDSYCCLGVACDISGLGEWEHDYDHRIYRVGEHEAQDSLLPETVRRWLGLRTASGRFSPVDALYVRNDKGHSFAEIADLIEAEPPGLFEETDAEPSEAA